MLLGEIELLTMPPSKKTASPQMLAIAMRDATRTRASPVERARCSVKRNLVDSSAARTGDSKAKLVAVRVGIGLDSVARSFGPRSLDDACAALNLSLCHTLSHCAESLVVFAELFFDFKLFFELLSGHSLEAMKLPLWLIVWRWRTAAVRNLLILSL